MDRLSRCIATASSKSLASNGRDGGPSGGHIQSFQQKLYLATHVEPLRSVSKGKPSGGPGYPLASRANVLKRLMSASPAHSARKPLLASLEVSGNGRSGRLRRRTFGPCKPKSASVRPWGSEFRSESYSLLDLRNDPDGNGGPLPQHRSASGRSPSFVRQMSQLRGVRQSSAIHCSRLAHTSYLLLPKSSVRRTGVRLLQFALGATDESTFHGDCVTTSDP